MGHWTVVTIRFMPNYNGNDTICLSFVHVGISTCGILNISTNQSEKQRNE